MRNPIVVSALAGAVLLGGCASVDDAARAPFKLTRGAEGLAHISAPDLRSAAAGIGYGYATDNFCLLQDQLLTVNGERSKHLGAEGRVDVQTTRQTVSNLESDFFYRFYIGGDIATRLWERADADSRDLVAGYVEGVNRYLAQTAPARIDPACRDQPWLRPLTLADGYRLLMDKAILASAANFIPAFVAAQPPQAAVAQGNAEPQPDAARQAVATPASLGLPEPTLGSNGWAFGRDRAEGGRALLFGNPHFPWTSTNRFWQFRLTVPGRFDVVGASLGGFPVVNIGYTAHLAWTHTVSTGRRFTLHELSLKAGDPTRYLVDGQERALQPVDVRVEVATPQGLQVRSQRFWRSSFGPLLVLPRAGLNWGAQRAYAFGDVNLDNNRMLRSWLDLAQARNVRDARTALARELGIPWVNTIAADASGEVLYADLSPIPNVDAALLAACAPSPGAAALMKAAFLPVLDGSREACRWRATPGTPVAGLMPAEQLAAVIRSDHVANQNDSYWLAHPDITWPSLSPMLGPVGVVQRPRTRAQLQLFERRFAGTDGLPGQRMSAEALQTLWARNNNFMAQVVLQDLVPLCQGDPHVRLADGETVSLAKACTVLQRWDRQTLPPSRGAHLFREFWRVAADIPGVHAVPFDPRYPAHTPRGLRLTDPQVRQGLLMALAQAVRLFDQAGVALDAELGSVQFVPLGNQRVAIPGGDEFEGVLDKQESRPFADGRYVPFFGTSYVQLVTLDERGARAKGILTYSQSTDPTSPWFGNQLRAHSERRLLPLPTLMR